MLSYSGHFVFYAKNHGFLGPPLRPPRWARGFPRTAGPPLNDQPLQAPFTTPGTPRSAGKGAAPAASPPTWT